MNMEDLMREIMGASLPTLLFITSDNPAHDAKIVGGNDTLEAILQFAGCSTQRVNGHYNGEDCETIVAAGSDSVLQVDKVQWLMEQFGQESVMIAPSSGGCIEFHVDNYCYVETDHADYPEKPEDESLDWTHAPDAHNGEGCYVHSDFDRNRKYIYNYQAQGFVPEDLDTFEGFLANLEDADTLDDILG